MRAGYVAQEEVARYRPPGALVRLTLACWQHSWPLSTTSALPCRHATGHHQAEAARHPLDGQLRVHHRSGAHTLEVTLGTTTTAPTPLRLRLHPSLWVDKQQVQQARRRCQEQLLRRAQRPRRRQTRRQQRRRTGVRRCLRLRVRCARRCACLTLL